MDLLDSSNLSAGLFLAALAAAIFILLRRSHRILGRRKQDDSPMVRVPRPRQGPSQHATLDAPPDVLRWEVQMHETARDLSAQLDSKMSALQALIADADRAAARLETAMARSADLLPSDSSPPTQAEALGPSRVVDAAEDGHSPSSQHREEIYLLADYGLDAAAIASRVGLPIGEVELMLSLRDKTK